MLPIRFRVSIPEAISNALSTIPLLSFFTSLNTPFLSTTSPRFPPLLELHHRQASNHQLIHKLLRQLPRHNLQSPLLLHTPTHHIEPRKPFPLFSNTLQAIPPNARNLPLEHANRALEGIGAREPARGIHGEQLSVDDKIDGARERVEGYGCDGLRGGRGEDLDVGFRRGPVGRPGVAEEVYGRGLVAVVDCAAFLGKAFAVDVEGAGDRVHGGGRGLSWVLLLLLGWILLPLRIRVLGWVAMGYGRCGAALNLLFFLRVG